MVQEMDRRLLGALIIFAAVVAALPFEWGASPGPAHALSAITGTVSPGDP
jgi:hypothetical protein